MPSCWLKACVACYNRPMKFVINDSILVCVAIKHLKQAKKRKQKTAVRLTISRGFGAICLLFKIKGCHFVSPGTELQNTPGPCSPRRNLWCEWKLFLVACKHANMIVFGWEVESFGEKLVLSGECYWCCNSTKGFFTRLSYFFYKGLWNIDYQFLETKRDLVHLLLGRNKRYPEMTSREQVNGWVFPVTGGHWFSSLK